MILKDKNTLAIGLGLGLVILSNLIGHFAPPFSIFATPIYLPVIIAVINFYLYKSNFILTIVYDFGLLLFNDLFIRFYAGGSHDEEGKGWIMGFSFVAFVLAFIIMTIYSFTTLDGQNKTFITLKIKNILTNIFFVLIFATLTGLIYYNLIADI